MASGIEGPDISNVPPIRVLYARRAGPAQASVDAAWSDLYAFAKPRGLWRRDVPCFGIDSSQGEPLPAGHLSYDAAILLSAEVEVERNIGITIIGGGRHAVFVHHGPHSRLAAAYDEILGTWLPASAEKRRSASTFERYLDDPQGPNPEPRTEIYVPLV